MEGAFVISSGGEGQLWNVEDPFAREQFNGISRVGLGSPSGSGSGSGSDLDSDNSGSDSNLIGFTVPAVAAAIDSGLMGYAVAAAATEVVVLNIVW